MPDDENYQINQHPWLVLTAITPHHQARPRCHRHGVMWSGGHLGAPGLTQAVAARGSLSGRNYISPPHRLSTLHWEHYPHRILRHCTNLAYRYPLAVPIAHHNMLMRYVLLPVFHFIITSGPYLRQPLNFPSKDQICLILNLNFHVPTTASLAGH